MKFLGIDQKKRYRMFFASLKCEYGLLPGLVLEDMQRENISIMDLGKVRSLLKIIIKLPQLFKNVGDCDTKKDEHSRGVKWSHPL